MRVDKEWRETGGTQDAGAIYEPFSSHLRAINMSGAGLAFPSLAPLMRDVRIQTHAFHQRTFTLAETFHNKQNKAMGLKGMTIVRVKPLPFQLSTMFKNYLLIAFRHFLREKRTTLINLAGLGVGLASTVLQIA